VTRVPGTGNQIVKNQIFSLIYLKNSGIFSFLPASVHGFLSQFQNFGEGHHDYEINNYPGKRVERLNILVISLGNPAYIPDNIGNCINNAASANLQLRVAAFSLE
jgi:hypothetical protein